MQDVKYKCDKCGFENHIQGYCPMCEEGYMKKVCECNSGNYAYTCCEPELEDEEKEMKKRLTDELEKEKAKEIERLEKIELERQAKEDAELENQENVE